jgi:hypothetical protein
MRKMLLVLVLLFVATSAFAQTQFRGSAKFVCGKVDQASVDAFAFAPGVYYTTINVTNPSDTSPVDGRKRFSVALLRQKPGQFTQFFGWGLNPGQSMQVDCSDIYGHLGIPIGTFIDGFVHFVAGPVRYDVTAVYTLTDGSRVVSQDVEEVTIR